MIAWFARNSVAANLLMVTIIVAGILSIKTELILETFPSSDPNVVSVNVALRGATPEDMELSVASRIEEAVRDLEGIEKMTSISQEGASRVTLELESDYDPRELLDDVKSRVDAINTFPSEAEKPVIALAARKFSVINVVVAGPHSEQEILEYADQVREDLLRIEGITQVELDSVRNYEIAVETSQDRLREWNLSLEDIARAISNSSVDVSAGNLRSAGGDVLIRSKGQAYRRDDFESIVVKTNADGSIIRLRDVATVHDGFEEELLTTRYNGKRAAFVAVQRVGDQSSLDIGEKVKNYVAAKQGNLPQGITLDYWDDDSKALKERLGILQKNAIQGAILVILLLALFLRPSIAFWVFIGIPVSFLGAFIIMGIFDVTLNIMSAFGFIVVLGIVVDDAIVTGENVYTHLRHSETSLDAAINGTREVAIPVTFGVLTTILAFSPLMLFMEGRIADVFSQIPAVVIPVLLFSLLESKFVLPAHLAHIRLTNGDSRNAVLRGINRWQKKFADRLEYLILNYFRPALEVITEHRYATLASFFGLCLLILALVFTGWARFVFFPNIEGDTGTASLTMPVGTPFDVTDDRIQRISDAARALQDKYTDPETGESDIHKILAVSGSAGGRGASSNAGYVTIEITPPEQRTTDITMREVMNEWRDLVGTLPGAESLTFRSFMFRAGSPVDIQLAGNSLEALMEAGNQVKARLATYPTVYEIADSLSDGKEELNIELTPQGHILGLTRSAIASQVSDAFKGLQAQRIQRGRDDVRVLVRLSREERSTLETLNQMLITTPTGAQVQLASVATLSAGKGPSAITRINGRRVLNVTAEVDKENTNMTVLQADLARYMDQLLLQYPGITYTFEGEADEQRKSFSSLESGMLVVLFGIYCLLALPLRSYIQPVVVMSVIPFGLIGCVLGHWIMGRDLSIGSLFGMLALIGVMVNDSLVLVDYVNQRRRKGIELYTAVLEAGSARFRPVLLTTLSTFFGLAPLLLEKSISAQFLQPMAISLGFGILFATFVTLLMVPCNILIVEDGKRLVAKLMGRSDPHATGVTH